MTDPILLVEDDRAIATVITSALEGEGYAVDSCADIATRDRLLGMQHYACMLTDVVLEDGDGIATLDRVRSAVGEPRIPTLSTFWPIEKPSMPFSMMKVVMPRLPSSGQVLA